MSKEYLVWLGIVRIKVLRVVQYGTFVTVITSAATAVQVGALPLWGVIVLLFPMALLYLLDPWMVKGEQKYFTDNNKQLQDIFSGYRELVEEVKKLQELVEKK